MLPLLASSSEDNIQCSVQWLVHGGREVISRLQTLSLDLMFVAKLIHETPKRNNGLLIITDSFICDNKTHYLRIFDTDEWNLVAVRAARRQAVQSQHTMRECPELERA